MSAQTAHQQSLQRRSSIGRRLFLLIIAIATMTAVLMAIGSAWRETSRDADAKKQEVTGLAQALAVTVADPLARGDQVAIRKVLWAMSRIPAFAHAKVEDAVGQEVESLGIAAGPQEDNRGFIPFRSRIQSSVPIRKNGKHIGTLTMQMSTPDLSGRLTSDLLVGFGAVLLSGLVGLVFAYRMQRRITEPIERLTRNMWHVRETNDFAHTVAHHSQDETGALVDAFNDMLAQIHSRDERLARHRANLEQTIKLPTRDLRAAEAHCGSEHPAAADCVPAPPTPLCLIASGDATETAPIESELPAEDMPVIDEEVLADAVGGDIHAASELVTSVLGLFEAHAPEALLKLALSARNDGAKDTADAAHALTSMARNIGAMRLAEACAVLEADAQSEQLGDLPDRLEVLKRDLVEVLQAIERWRSTGSDLHRSSLPHRS